MIRLDIGDRPSFGSEGPFESDGGPTLIARRADAVAISWK